MKPSVYLETSVISYLAARPSSDIRAAAWQNITADWWDNRREDFALFVSTFVLAEASRGNAEAAARRVALIDDLPQLDVLEAVKPLVDRMLDEGAIPPKAELDAFHVAVAAVHGIDYLLTWNCTHIANAVTRPRIESICREAGYEPPVICTPTELLEG